MRAKVKKKSSSPSAPKGELWRKPHPIELRSFSFREPQRGMEMEETEVKGQNMIKDE
jgi:hypothetical protein